MVLLRCSEIEKKLYGGCVLLVVYMYIFGLVSMSKSYVLASIVRNVGKQLYLT